MNKGTAIAFLQKFLAHTHSPEEHQVFLNWLKTANEKDVEQVLIEYEALVLQTRFTTVPDNRLLESIEIRLNEEAAVYKPQAVIVRTIPWWRKKWVAAAAVLIIISTATYFWLNRNKQQVMEEKKMASMQDIPPGGNRAILTLADGSTIVLDSAKNGAIARQGNSTVTKLEGGQLAYSTPTETEQKIIYNTIHTPKGGQYILMLPDGTKAWLNADSWIKYPVSFTGNSRQVEMNGEVYFEVAKNSQKPFKVNNANLSVEVLGTHFNVNSYDDEQTKTVTLLEGSIKCRPANDNKESSLLLEPGWQAILTSGSETRVDQSADTAAIVAWKNGWFQFENADIATIMRQIARWYNVEVKFEKNITHRFFVEISRNTNVSEVLRALELTGRVHFKVEGRLISVLP